MVRPLRIHDEIKLGLDRHSPEPPTADSGAIRIKIGKVLAHRSMASLLHRLIEFEN